MKLEKDKRCNVVSKMTFRLPQDDKNGHTYMCFCLCLCVCIYIIPVLIFNLSIFLTLKQNYFFLIPASCCLGAIGHPNKQTLKIYIVIL